MRSPSDRRYGSTRWKVLRKLILRRDHWQCWVAGCQDNATVADHILPVHPDMPDHDFFDPANLRASCRLHNIARAGDISAARPRGAGNAPSDTALRLGRPTMFSRRR